MATPFSPQLVIPAAGNPYYNTKKVGGYNPCIMGNPKNRNKDLNALPNCVGYAVGRFNEIYHEIMGGSGCEYLGNTNAANFIQPRTETRQRPDFLKRSYRHKDT